jgi:hypothetical protein
MYTSIYVYMYHHCPYMGYPCVHYSLWSVCTLQYLICMYTTVSDLYVHYSIWSVCTLQYLICMYTIVSVYTRARDSSLSLSHTHTLIHTPCICRLSLHTLSLPLSHTYTHTHTHTHIHTGNGTGSSVWRGERTRATSWSTPVVGLFLLFRRPL